MTPVGSFHFARDGTGSALALTALASQITRRLYPRLVDFGQGMERFT